ncbi:MAG: DUF6011 domain-containing protein [Mycobacterium sp.]
MTPRKRPALTDRPIPNYTDTAKFTAHRRQDGFTAPTPADRADIDVLIAAAERGFRLTVRCLDCGRWLADSESVRLHLGPVCRGRRVAP